MPEHGDFPVEMPWIQMLSPTERQVMVDAETIARLTAERDEARTALAEAVELLNGTRFGVTPSELLLIEDFLASQEAPK